MFLLGVGVCLAGCTRQSSPPTFERLAILRFENLGSDASADWMGRAFSEVITAELAGAPRLYAIPSARMHSYERSMGARPVSAPGISAERDLALVSGANRIGYGYYEIRGGRLEVRLAIENPQTGKMSATIDAAGPAEDVIGTASALARRLWGASPAYQTRAAPALKAYIGALESSEPQTVVRNLNEAIAADPNFGPAYLLLAQVQSQQQDRAGAGATIRTALSRPLPTMDRARLELQGAELRADAGARLQALESLSKQETGDPVAWRLLAGTFAAAGRYDAAAKAYRQAVEIEPQDPATLNQFGYALAHTGDLAGAMAALRQYQALRPGDANPLDSMGDVNLLLGRMREAEGFYLESARKEPHFERDGSLFKAAMARLMTGDIGGADALARRYLDARAADKDPAVAYLTAEWSWAAGRRAEAMRQMQDFARGAEQGPLRELASRAYAELTVWNLLAGDRPAAIRTAAQSAKLMGPSSAGISAVAQFLAQPQATPAEWSARAERRFVDPGQTNIKRFALAYALLLEKQFQPAAPLLKEIDDSGATANDEGLQVLLGWAYLETGRTRDAAPLIRFNPIPSSSGPGPFSSFYFPRLYYLRGLEAERNGNRGEAQANYDLFRKLSGPLPLVWDK